jgi:hypothetical protein
MNITTKFDIGQTIYPISVSSERIACENCGSVHGGESKWSVGDAFSPGNIDININSENVNIQYWLYGEEDYHDTRYVDEKDSFASSEEAQDECVKRNKELKNG